MLSLYRRKDINTTYNKHIMNIRNIISLMLLWISTITMAQETKPVSLQFEARADYMRTNIDGKHIKDQSGFKGYVVNVILKGDISPKFSYAFRNRLNGINKDYNFFNSTDWLYLKYKPNKNVAAFGRKSLRDFVARGGSRRASSGRISIAFPSTITARRARCRNSP